MTREYPTCDSCSHVQDVFGDTLTAKRFAPSALALLPSSLTNYFAARTQDEELFLPACLDEAVYKKMKVESLKRVCDKFCISSKGRRSALIDRVLAALK